jgi:hypothetical protein
MMQIMRACAGGVALLLVCAACEAATVVEYYNTDLGHYFITPLVDEVAALDSGRFAGWVRTGLSFDAYATDAHLAGATPVCRFFITLQNTSSHFYGTRGTAAVPGDCELTTQLFPEWTLESDQLFYSYDPQRSGGACPAAQYPVYRLYNNGEGGIPNHRFTNSPAIRAQMLALGFSDEGPRLCTTSASPPAPEHAGAKGVWHGKTDEGRAFDVLVLADGNFFITYSYPGTTSYVGTVHGTGSRSATSFASNNAQDHLGETTGLPKFGFDTAISGTADGNVLTLSSGSASVVAGYDTGYDKSTGLATIAGTHIGPLGHDGEQFNATIDIGADGSLLIQGTQCDYAGTIAARPDDDTYDVVVHGARGVCATVPDLAAGVHGTLFHSTAVRGYVATFPFNNTATGRVNDLLFFVAR